MFAGQRPKPLSLKRISTTTRDLWSEPSSPASLSWTDEKSTSELVVLLKNAHASLREKEKDLTLAAELGHYLLEKNTALKSQYEELLHQQEQYNECNDDMDNDDHDSDNALLLLSQHQAHQQVLTDLQDKNVELQRLLDDAQQQTDKLQTARDKKARELEYDITLLKDHLEMASRRIEEMEDDQHYRNVRQRQQYQHTRRHHYQHSGDNQCNNQQQQQQQQHDSVLMELREKINQLESENNQLVHTRQLVQSRLDRALTDVDALQTQCHFDEWTRERYTQLNDAYQQQFNHIAQLNVSLEEHRHVLANLVDRGNWTDHRTSSNTPIMVTGIDNHLQNDHRNDNLMIELEKTWHRDQSLNTGPDHGTPLEILQQPFSNGLQQDDGDDDGYPSLVSVGIKLQQQDSFDSAVYLNDASSSDSAPPSSPPALDHVPLLNYTDNSDSQVFDHVNSDTDDDDDDDGDDGDVNLFGPEDAMDAITSYNLYPTLVVAGKQPKVQSSTTTGMVHKAQRWCRFAIVLTMAALINAFEGPDAMLDEMY
ncbi:hypothetical protein BCR42DRAFT_493649 [Absidia repens]|uniref:HAP1 N-terminal domain-containing protein n=1 Tax=Absidia repens TaxID=90262 RepID=A0A1X2I9E8_9FUNG|nr:hypothetical protein BCR42DRAFT_493649 [Absidia repens]